MDTTGFKVIKLDMDDEYIAAARKDIAAMWKEDALDGVGRPNADNSGQGTFDGERNLLAQAHKLLEGRV